MLEDVFRGFKGLLSFLVFFFFFIIFQFQLRIWILCCLDYLSFKVIGRQGQNFENNFII